MNKNVKLRALTRMFEAIDKPFAGGKNEFPESNFDKDLIRMENSVTLTPVKTIDKNLHVCPLCGRLMLGFFDRINLNVKETGETICLHQKCYDNFYETVQRMETLTKTHEYDYEAEMKYYREHAAIIKKHPAVFDPDSETYKLREYLQHQTKPFLTITFSELEKITGKKLPPECRTVKFDWNMNTKARNYLLGIYLGGYKFFDIDPLNQKLFLDRNKDLGLNKLVQIKYFHHKIPFQSKFIFDCELRRIYKKYGIDDLDNYNMQLLLKELKKREEDNLFLK